MATRPDPPPWKRKNPKKTAKKATKKLTSGQRAQARGRARAAGRPYPNLVDNMAVARKAPKKATGKKGIAKKR